MCIIISKKPHVYVSVVKILIRNNDYFHFMISTKTRVINLKTGSIIVAVNLGQAASWIIATHWRFWSLVTISYFDIFRLLLTQLKNTGF